MLKMLKLSLGGVNTKVKTISVVLTKCSDRMSNFLWFFCGFGYTHASISLDDTSKKMYSFNHRGFCFETKEMYHKRGVKKSVCYQLEVSDDTYIQLQKALQYFRINRHEYSYSKFGAVLCFLRIPFKRKKHYFCSQFVAELLSEAGAIELKKKPSLYLPNQLGKELGRSISLRDIKYNIL